MISLSTASKKTASPDSGKFLHRLALGLLICLSTVIPARLCAQSKITIRDSVGGWRLEHFAMLDTLTPTQLLSSKVNWADWEVQVDSITKDSYLLRIQKNPIFPNLNYFVREAYRLIDFDGDGLLDLIYTGREPSGMEFDNVVLYRNTGDSLQILANLPGTIVEILRESKSEPIEFVIWVWPCCDGQLNELTHYYYYKGSDHYFKSGNHEYSWFRRSFTPNYQSRDLATFVKTTFLPEGINLESQEFFAVASDSTELLTNPGNPFLGPLSMGDFIPYGYEGNLVIAKLPAGQVGHILAEQIFDGVEYCFVRIDLQYAVSPLTLKGKSYWNLLGWIRKADLRIP